ncbi:MAG: flagella basal body P-ring formation protein FlgA [Novosphingobium sp.]|nr:flagella basal body P-ring formation protein FlgA [Novosphingobium sp.]
MTIATAVALAAAALPASAGFADLDAIESKVVAFTGAGIGAAGGPVRPLDRRLRLRACLSEIALDWRAGRRDTVTVRCTDPGGWSLFVPVMATTPASTAYAPAAAPSVRRGDAVSLSISGSGFTVSRPAEALDNGATGDWIRVRPVTDRRMAEEPLRARIVRPGLVSIAAN